MCLMTPAKPVLPHLMLLTPVGAFVGLCGEMTKVLANLDDAFNKLSNSIADSVALEDCPDCFMDLIHTVESPDGASENFTKALHAPIESLDAFIKASIDSIVASKSLSKASNVFLATSESPTKASDARSF